MPETDQPAPIVDSPPAAPAGPAASPEEQARARLHRLAEILSRGMSRNLLAEYLRLRRAYRA